MPKYFLHRNISTVLDLWREWSVGIGNEFSVRKLNELYGFGWQVDWPSRERQYYFQRLVIIDHIYCLGGLGPEREPLRPYEEVAKQLNREQEKKKFDALANQIKKAQQ